MTSVAGSAVLSGGSHDAAGYDRESNGSDTPNDYTDRDRKRYKESFMMN